MLWLALAVVMSADGGTCSKRSDCALDAETKTCRAAKTDYDGEAGPLPSGGSTCVCENSECKPFTVEPVACKTWRDCSYSTEPFLRPVSSKTVKRLHPKPVRPCRDSERDAVCDPDTRTCRVVAWKC